MTEDKKWVINLTDIPDGIFRTMNGNGDELIAIGRVIKAGFPCSRVDVTNAKYDAIVDLGGNKKNLLRIQIKGTRTKSINFLGGVRSGEQISRESKSRAYKYTKEDCDLFIGVYSFTGDCYIIPIKDLALWGNTKSLSKLQFYKENWGILINIAKELTNKNKKEIK